MLGYLVNISFTFQAIAKLFSKGPYLSPCMNVWEVPPIYILVSTWYCQILNLIHRCEEFSNRYTVMSHCGFNFHFPSDSGHVMCCFAMHPPLMTYLLNSTNHFLLFSNHSHHIYVLFFLYTGYWSFIKCFTNVFFFRSGAYLLIWPVFWVLSLRNFGPTQGHKDFSPGFSFRMFTVLGFAFICPLQVSFCSKLFSIEK